MIGTHKELPYGNIALPLGSDSFRSAKVGHYTTRARVFPGCNSSLRRYPSVMKKRQRLSGVSSFFLHPLAFSHDRTGTEKGRSHTKGAYMNK